MSTSSRFQMIFGVVMWSASTLTASFMTNYWAFMTLRALTGVGEAMFSVVSPTIISGDNYIIRNLLSKIQSTKTYLFRHMHRRHEIEFSDHLLFRNSSWKVRKDNEFLLLYITLLFTFTLGCSGLGFVVGSGKFTQ